MARPSFRTSEFAAWLCRQRGHHSLEDMARKVRKAVGGVIAFDRSSWQKLEEGQLPNIIQLWGIAKTQRVPLEELARRILQDLDVPVDQPASIRQAPPLSVNAEAIARRYEEADESRRNAVRFILEGSAIEPKVAGKERQDDQRARTGRRRSSR